MFGLRLTAPYAFIVRARGGAVKVGEDTKKPKAKPSVSGAADETESEPEESASVTCLLCSGCVEALGNTQSIPFELCLA